MTSQQPSEKLGAYRIVKPIGKGGAGQVLLAVDERLGRQVAIKRLHPSLSCSPNQVARLQREARAIARLNHPNIVQLYDVMENNHLVMEYVKGVTLAERLKNGALENPLDLAIQIADALGAAHREGVVHRDIKAENIMVTPEGRVKILDFGLARPLDTQDATITSQGQLVGTFRAMSPEQTHGGEVDYRGDLFSMGSLFYEMFSGVPPFQGDRPLEVIRNIQRMDPLPLDALNPAIDGHISQMVVWLLEKDPADRPESAEQVARVLNLIKTGEFAELEATELQKREAIEEEAQPNDLPKPSHKGKAALAATFLLLLCGALFLFRSQNKAPVRVALGPPLQQETSATTGLMASGTLETVRRALAHFKGITLVEVDTDIRDAPALGKAVGAHEVLFITLVYGEPYSKITLARHHGNTGDLLWSKTLELPSQAQEAYARHNALVSALNDGYKGFGKHPYQLTGKVRPEDYRDYLEVLHNGNHADFSKRHQMIDEVTKGSPGFVDGFLLATETALAQYHQTGDWDHLMLAESYLNQLHERQPKGLHKMPRYLTRQFQVNLARADYEASQHWLTLLEKTSPSNVEHLKLKALLLERKGDLEAATHLLQEAVSQVMDWRTLHQLALYEQRQNLLPMARKHFNQLLELSPQNPWGLQGLADLEMMLGDTPEAERLFAELATIKPGISAYNNLGTVRLWLGKFEEAEEAFAQANRLNPTHLHTRWQLAYCRLFQGHEHEARENIRAILTEIDRQEQKRAETTDLNRTLNLLIPHVAMIKAHCLVRLGSVTEGTVLAQEILSQEAGNPQLHVSAAALFTAAGQTDLALECIEKALARGSSVRWFMDPGFDQIREHEKFKQLTGE